MNKKKAANYIQDLGALIALVLLIVVIGAISPEFRTVGNFLSLLRQSSINGLIAFGMTCVILTVGIGRYIFVFASNPLYLCTILV